MQWKRFVVIAAVLSCGGPLVRITIEESAQTTVPSGGVLEQLLGDFGFGDFLDMDIVGAEELQNQGVGPGDIRDVYLVEFSLEATDPPGADLSFIQELSVFVESPDLPRVRVAWQTDFPEGQALVPFELEDVDLTDYAVSRSMTLSTEVTGRRPAQDTSVEGAFALQIGVTRQGVCNQLASDEGSDGSDG